jgi:hypothetical protein
MAKRVFFSFHYDNDITRAQTVRNSWVTKPDRESAGFFDASIREEAETKGDAALKALIASGLKNTSVTAVLIGSETATRQWVLEEIAQSVDRGNGLIGIRIHNIKNLQGQTSTAGANPFALSWTKGGESLDLSPVPLYDWVLNNGYANFGSWVSQAYVAE